MNRKYRIVIAFDMKKNNKISGFIIDLDHITLKNHPKNKKEALQLGEFEIKKEILRYKKSGYFILEDTKEIIIHETKTSYHKIR